MKLYLTSYRVPTPGDLVELVGKPPVETRVVIIPNAKDYELPQDRGFKLDELTSDLQKMGFLQPDTVDLREFDDGEQVYEALKSYDLLWVAGGNSFVLRSEMHRSGFDKVIRRLLDEGQVYGGESAGAIVAGLSLQGFEVGDDPELADQIIWEGLGLTDRIIAPHADSPNFIEYVNHMKKLYKDNDRVMYLKDTQVLVVDGNNVRIVAS
ncbi:MAG: Type 1 glutamine amidotransferase-like domain-containing protein [Patescibacteria group bacterium]